MEQQPGQHGFQRREISGQGLEDRSVRGRGEGEETSPRAPRSLQAALVPLIYMLAHAPFHTQRDVNAYLQCL